MIDNNTYTLVDNQTGELAFKLYRFDNISHFDHIQRPNYYSLIWIYAGSGEAQVETEKHSYEANTIFACTPYQPFMLQSNENVKGVVINFHPDFFLRP